MCKNAANHQVYAEDQNNDVVEFVHQGNALACSMVLTHFQHPSQHQSNCQRSSTLDDSEHPQGGAVLQESFVKPPNQRHKPVVSMDALLEGHGGYNYWHTAACQPCRFHYYLTMCDDAVS